MKRACEKRRKYAIVKNAWLHHTYDDTRVLMARAMGMSQMTIDVFVKCQKS
jgi:hypothetical protein